ncbi:MAG: fibronectin type III domain-containing protein, partial [Elusimicrobiota bacterium]
MLIYTLIALLNKNAVSIESRNGISIFSSFMYQYNKNIGYLLAAVLLMLPISVYARVDSIDITDGGITDYNNAAYMLVLNDPKETSTFADIDDVYTAHTSTQLYISFKNQAKLNKGAAGRNTYDYFIYIDKDQSAGTGYPINGAGADYLLTANVITVDGIRVKTSKLKKWDGYSWSISTSTNLEAYTQDTGSYAVEFKINWTELNGADGDSHTGLPPTGRMNFVFYAEINGASGDYAPDSSYIIYPSTSATPADKTLQPQISTATILGGNTFNEDSNMVTTMTVVSSWQDDGTSASVDGCDIQGFNFNIVSAEYFYDTDPGIGNGYTLSADDGSFNQVTETSTVYGLDISSLANGDHTLYTRCMNYSSTTVYGLWSSTVALILSSNRSPGTITTLTAAQSAGYDHAIKLSWIAPGDNGYNDNITGGKYWIKSSSTANITDETTWIAAVYSVQLTTDTVPGQNVNHTITGLVPLTTYYFAVKTADEVPNWSLVSSSAGNMCSDLNSPAAPTSLSAIDYPADEGSRINLNWILSSDDGNGSNDVLEYRIYKSSWITNPSYTLLTTIIKSTTFYTNTSVSMGTTYYYYLKSFDGTNTSVNTSTVNVFSIDNTAPATPNNLEATNPGTGADIYLAWSNNTETDLAGYNIYRSLDNPGAYNKVNVSLHPAPTDFYRDNSVSSNTTYWYKITAVDSSGNESLFSDIDVSLCIANNPPNVFSLTTPADLSTSTTLTPAFDWADATDPDSDVIRYELWYASNTTFIYKTVVDGLLTSTHTPVGSLQDNTTYWWKIMAFDPWDCIKWSTETDWKFWVNVINDTPTVFGLISPANTYVSTDLTPALDWEDSMDVDPNDSFRYGVMYSTDSVFGVYTSSTELAVSVYNVPSNLTDNATYYWKAYAYDTFGTTRTATQTTWKFYTNTADDAPIAFDVVSPANNNVETTLTPAFDWQDSTDPDPNDFVAYTLWYSTASNFSVKTEVTGLTDSAYTPSTNLYDNTVYYWKVKAVDTDGTTVWSTTVNRSFKVNQANDAPNSFGLVFPDNLTSVSDITPDFDWTSSADVDPGDYVRYRVVYSSVSNFSSYTSSAGLAYSAYTPTTELIEDTMYYWYIEAYDINNATTTSEVRRFNVNTVNNTPGAFALYTPSGTINVYDLTPYFDWQDSADPDGDIVQYDLQVSTNSNFSVYTYYTGNSTSTYTMTTSPLTNYTSYYWRIRGYDPAGLEVWGTNPSTAVFIAYDNIAPAGISGLTALTGSSEGAVYLAWTAPGDNGNSETLVSARWEIKYSSSGIITYDSYVSPPGTGYTMYVNTASITPGVGINYTITGLLSSTTYWFAIKTCDYGGNWAVWNSSQDVITVNTAASIWAQRDIIPPAAVSNLTAIVGTNDGEVVLSWTAPGDDNLTGTVSAYVLKYSSSGIINSAGFDTADTYSQSWQSLASAGQTESRVISGLIPAVTYWYAVKAVDNGSNLNIWRSSADIPTINLLANTAPKDNVPSTPGGLVIDSRGYTSVTLSWTGVNINDLAGYKLYYDTDTSDIEYTGTGSTGGGSPISVENVTSYVLTGLAQGTTYYISVRAVDTGPNILTSGYAAEVSTITFMNLPILPGNMNGIAVSSTSINWLWSDNSSNESGFYVKSSTNGVLNSLSANTTFWIEQGLNINTSYYRYVESYNFGGISSSTAVIKYTLANPATGFNFVNVYYSSVTLSWAKNNNPDNTLYELSVSSDNFVTHFSTPVNLSTALVDTSTAAYNLLNNTTYWFRIRAYNGNEIPSAYTAIVSTKTVFLNTPPSAFSLITSSGTVITRRPTITWTETTDPDEFDSISYEVMYSTTSGYTLSTTSNVGTATNYTFPPLIPYTTYYWKVTAGDTHNGTRTSTQSGWWLWIDSNTIPSGFSLITTSGTIESQTPRLAWGTVTDTDPGDYVRYEVIYSSMPDYTVSITSSGITLSEYQFTVSLEKSTTYWWKVNAYDTHGGTVASTQSDWQFYIPSQTSPTAFSLIKSSGTIPTRYPVLDWADSSDSDAGDYVRYEIRYSTAQDYSICVASTGLSASTYAIEAMLNPYTTYYWKVYAYDTTGGTTTSTQTDWQFVVSSNTVPTAFSLITSSGTVITRRPTITWTETTDPDEFDSISYEVMYSTTSGYTLSTTSNVGTATNYTFPPLIPYTTYYWKVTAGDTHNGTRTSTQSGWWLWIDSNTIPSGFSLITTSGTIESQTPRLAWGTVTDTDPGDYVRYEVIYSSMPDYTVSITSSGITLSEYQFTVSLEKSTTYWWKVNAYDTHGGTVASTQSDWQFYIPSQTSPTAFSLIKSSGTIPTRYPVLDWADSSDSDAGDYVRYEIRYSTAQDYSICVASTGLSASTYAIEAMLNPYTTYYWKVYAYDTTGGTTTSTQTDWQFVVSSNT